MSAFAAAALLAALLRADSWSPPTKALYMDETNRYLVLIDPTGPGYEPDFVFARAAKPRPAPDKNKRGRDTDPKPVLAKDDAVLAKGRLPQIPYRVLVSTSGRGFAVIESYAALGSGHAVIFVSSTGAATAGAELEQLFTREEIRAFPRSVSSTWWLADAWLDEAGGKVVVVSVTGLSRTVAFVGGSVAPSDADTLLRALRGGDEGVAKLAAGLLVLSAGPEALAALARLYDDPRTEPFTRLAAAAALSAHGDARGRPMLREVLSPDGLHKHRLGYEDKEFLVSRLGEVFREEAPAMLRRVLEQGLQADEAAFALAGLGDPGVAILLEVAGSTAADALGRHAAIDVFERMERPEAVPVLARAAWDPEDLVGDTAIKVLGRMRAPEAGAALKAMLEKGSPRDDQVAAALFFTSDRSVVPALIEALGRWPKGSEERDRIHLTLRYLSGQRLDPEPELWRAWLKGASAAPGSLKP